MRGDWTSTSKTNNAVKQIVTTEWMLRLVNAMSSKSLGKVVMNV